MKSSVHSELQSIGIKDAFLKVITFFGCPYFFALDAFFRATFTAHPYRLVRS